MTVGVIGAGSWGRNLVRTFYLLGELAAVAELNPDIRQGLAAEYPGVCLYRDCQIFWRKTFPP